MFAKLFVISNVQFLLTVPYFFWKKATDRLVMSPKKGFDGGQPNGNLGRAPVDKTNTPIPTPHEQQKPRKGLPESLNRKQGLQNPMNP
jgi:hypothetical protein